METLLRWLHVGSRGYTHGCIPAGTIKANHLTKNLSNAAFADDLACFTNTLKDLKAQAHKLTQYSDWAKLQVSGSKTKVTGILHGAVEKGIYGKDPSSQLKYQLHNTIHVQGQKAQFVGANTPFLYLGVKLIMDLDWTHQHKRMTSTLKA